MRRLMTYMLAALLPAAAQAVVVDCRAGELAALLTDRDVTELTITGQVDASDMEYIAMELTRLGRLDMSRAEVVAYAGDRLLTGLCESPAGVLPANALFGSPVTEVTLPAGLTAVGDNAFAASAIVSVTLPAGVTSVGEAAFAGCRSLRSLTLHGGITEAGAYLAAGCPALESVTIAGRLAAVPAHAFERCTSLSDVTLDDRIGRIDGYAFAGCGALTKFDFPTRLTAVGDFAFVSSGLMRAEMQGAGALESIGDFAFAGCGSLTVAVMPQSVTTIGDGAFMLDGLVRDICLPDVTYIGDFAMARMTGLESIDAVELGGVPPTGRDVWRGVGQSRVRLSVRPALVGEFSEAPQWCGFDIVGSDIGGVGDVAGNEAAGGISAWFDDCDLHVEADTELREVVLHDMSGRRLAAIRPDCVHAVVATQAYEVDVCIVSVLTGDGVRASFKLKRQ